MPRSSPKADFALLAAFAQPAAPVQVPLWDAELMSPLEELRLDAAFATWEQLSAAGTDFGAVMAQEPEWGWQDED